MQRKYNLKKEKNYTNENIIESNIIIDDSIIKNIINKTKETKNFIEYINYLINTEREIIKNIELLGKIEEKEEQYNYEKNIIHNSHDTSIRKILSNKNEVALFINKVLQLSKVNKEIKADMLERYETSLITKSYLNREADIIYKRKDMEVFFLIEHQSRIDYNMPIRIMEYVTAIITNYWYSNKDDIANRKYPLVIPIVLYIGKNKWNVEKHISSRQVKMPGYKSEYGKYTVFDANDYEDSELLQEKGALSKIILLEKTKGEKELQDNYIKISKEYLSQKEKDMIIEYLCNISSTKLSQQKINEIKKLFMKGEKSMLAEIFMEKEKKAWLGGREEGKREGIKEGKIAGIKEGKIVGKEEGIKESKNEFAKRLLKSGISIENIKNWTGLSEKEINSINENIQNKNKIKK